MKSDTYLNFNYFDTAEKKKEANSLFRGLVGHPGWQLLMKVLDEDVAALGERVLDGRKSAVDPASGKLVEVELSIEELRRLRDLRAIYLSVKNFPQAFIDFFEKGDVVKPPSVDPYATPADIDEEKKHRGVARK